MCVLCSGLWHRWPVNRNRAFLVLRTFNRLQIRAGNSGHVSWELKIPQRSDSPWLCLPLFSGSETRELVGVLKGVVLVLPAPLP